MYVVVVVEIFLLVSHVKILSIHSPSQQIKVLSVNMSSFFSKFNVHLLNRLLSLFCTTLLLVLHIQLFQQPGNDIDKQEDYVTNI